MKKQTTNILKHIIKQLNTIDASAIRDEVSYHYLTFNNGKGIHEANLAGNSEGLIYLAKELIAIAVSGIEGKHFHLDKNTMLDECDEGIVFSLKAAPWEE